jgi:hypothetical protein
MPNNRKRKGTRVEAEIVKHLETARIPARRVPLSGALKFQRASVAGDLEGDVVIGPPGRELRAEVKSRRGGAGFATLEGWLGTLDVLVLKRDRAAPFVALPWATFVALLQAGGYALPDAEG